MTAEADQAKHPSLITKFASRYSVEPNKLIATLKATAFKQPVDKQTGIAAEVSTEQLMALLIVADQYGLSPWTREIYAFPDRKRGGIVPIVSVDGWARIINEQEQLDGIEFIDGPEGDKHKNAPIWIDCVIFRKDRSHPTKIRERLAECFRDTDPWTTHPSRMLRHKALIQCARVAFALVGIYDEDEAHRIIEGEVTRIVEPSAISNINAEISGKNNGSKQGSDHPTIPRGSADKEQTRADPPTSDSPPGTFAGLADRMTAAARVDDWAQLNECLTLSEALPDEAQRIGLKKLYDDLQP